MSIDVLERCTSAKAARSCGVQSSWVSAAVVAGRDMLDVHRA